MQKSEPPSGRQGIHTLSAFCALIAAVFFTVMMVTSEKGEGFKHAFFALLAFLFFIHHTSKLPKDPP